MTGNSPRLWAVVGALCVLALSSSLAFVAGRVFAGSTDDPDIMTYAGTLQDASGTPLSGSHNVEIKLWTADPKVTDPLCTTNSQVVMLTAGRFSLSLPAACSERVHANRNVQSEVLVDGSSLGRAKLGVVPFALEAAHAAAAGHADTAAQADHALQADHAQSADSAKTAQSADVAVNALTTVFGTELIASDSFGAGCIAQPGVADCAVAAERKCRALGYKSGWFVGEWGSSADSNTRTISCVK